MNEDRLAKRGATKGIPNKKSLGVVIGVVILLAGYVLLRPILERKLGVQLPDLLRDDAALMQDDDDDPQASDVEQPTGTRRTENNDASDNVPPADRALPADGSVAYLRDVGSNTFQSPSGLRYRPGSLEGHRVDHILRHARDDPDRDIHGVFDGSPDEIFEAIDEAYEMAKLGGRLVETERDRSRTIHTVDLGRRVGFIGGRAGRRSDHPPATGVRLVLENRNVITAFPVKP